MIASESASAVRGGEPKGVLRMVAGLPEAGRHRLLCQALYERASGRMILQKAGYRIGSRLAGSRVRKLGLQERQEVFGSPHGKPFDRVRQDVGVLTVR